ncbi:MAG: HAD-IIIA family hydrolase [Caldithrix sp.]|nr:HAD-IIIA family hydrolase [Caldithrix sp.]
MNGVQNQVKAVFLDRDGTLNEEMGYINHQSRFRIFEFVPEAIKKINDAGYLAIVITNQSGIARGYFDEQLLQRVHDKLLNEASLRGGRIEKIYYCPHHPTEGIGHYKMDCSCRKPKIGMLKLAEKEFQIDLNGSIMIGDRYKDIEFAHRAGLKAIMVLSGYGIGEYTYQRFNWKEQPDLICENINEAAERLHEI